MPIRFEDCDFAALNAEGLVKSTNNADELVYMLTEEEFNSAGKEAAAKKLLKMWKEGRANGITLDHLAYVGDYADEPSKSEANQIIRNNL